MTVFPGISYSYFRLTLFDTIMETTRLSSKGQIIIPKQIRTAHQWAIGLELQVIEVPEGILLKPKAPFRAARLDEVAGCLPYDDETKSEAEINKAMREAARKAWRDSD
ncbi:AbrB/MazE/SpoVT family DNA-binding domain-containing protein [Porticoccus sp. GXU_MW_L64]